MSLIILLDAGLPIGQIPPRLRTFPLFPETFPCPLIDCGQVDTFEVVKTLREVGFDGFMIDDHVPRVAGDSPWGHRGRAHCIGYMQALIQVVEKLYP